MSLKDKMRLQEAQERVRESTAMELYKNDKNFRADRLVAVWKKVPEIGANFGKLSLQEARNTAINLDRQCAWMQSLRESQLATALNDFTPENMLRLVRLAMPNIIRNKVFTEFALETTKDSIKYVRPFFSKTANGHPINDAAQDYDGSQGADYDPWGYSKGGEFNGDDFRKALYEDTRDRHNGEHRNAIVASSTEDGPAATVTAGATLAAGDNYVAVFFKKTDPSVVTNLSAEGAFESGKWGENGQNYVDGYTYLYYGQSDAPADTAKLEQNVIAIQDKGSGQFFGAPGFTVEIVKSPQVRDKFLVQPVKAGPGNAPDATTAGRWNKLVGTDGTLLPGLNATGVFILKVTVDADSPAIGQKLLAYGRFNSESDFEGNYLGEVEIRMDEYTFKPSATSIGVSWSQLTEITLDTSFNISAEETLVTYASQEIRSALDYRAIRLAYAVAKTNAKHNPMYTYEFDAHWGGNTSLEGYIANAQTFSSAINAVQNVMYDEINRGGVSRIVGGPDACAYMNLCAGYNDRGQQNAVGSFQFGEVYGRPVFQVPSAIIPTNELLCVKSSRRTERKLSKAA